MAASASASQAVASTIERQGSVGGDATKSYGVVVAASETEMDWEGFLRRSGGVTGARTVGGGRGARPVHSRCHELHYRTQSNEFVAATFYDSTTMGGMAITTTRRR